MSFRAGASLLACCTPFLGLLSVFLLVGMLSPTLGVVYEKEKLSLS